jgi:predicted acylesterase/phospholipase RssA
VDSAVGAGAARATLGEQEHDRVARWLDTAEAGTSSLVLVADREDSAWTTRCVRQADVVLLVGRPRSRPARLPARLASPRQGAHDRRELILVHPEGTDRPSGAAPWLGAIAVDAWHHVRLGVPDDFRRVARFLTGRAVGLAMSGGAARGFAHIGVLRALREAGVPIDLVCGTSMGSWVAAMASLNWSDARIAKIMQEEMVDRSPLDYQLPVLAMAGGRRFDAMLLALFGDGLAEDTWRRFFSVCCSLTRSTVVRHSTGSLARAVRASCSLPGLFPPVVEGGEVLVDGVFLDNLPAEAAAQAGAGRTIAVNVLPPVAGDWENFADRSTLRQVARMLSPRAEDRLPPIVKLGMQGVFLGTANASARIRREVDLFIEPAVGKIWFLDFGACKRVIELGYEAAKPAIADWLRRDPSVLVG